MDATTYHLPEHLRENFKKPLGTLYPRDTIIQHIHTELRQPAERIITVGDITTRNLLKAGITPHLAIIDQKTKRNHRAPATPPTRYQHQKHVHNPPATITEELINTIHETLSHKTPTIIIVEGEEDLAVLPAALLSPDTSIVIYGQPDEGAVLIRVNPTTRQKIQKLLNKMEAEESTITDQKQVKN